MKSFTIIFVILLGAALAGKYDELNSKYGKHLHGKDILTSLKTNEIYEEYLTVSGKERSEAAFKVFAENLNVIIEHNSTPDKTWSQGLNNYSDMTEQEFIAYYKLDAEQHCSATRSFDETRFMGTKMPRHVDWRERGVVTPVKDQGQCGSCWTFSSTGAIESHFAINTWEHATLSQQQLIDCAGDFDNHGCNGGLPSHAFEYLNHTIGGLELETTYGYQAKDQTCKYNRNKAVVSVDGSFNITQGDEVQQAQACDQAGPIAVSYQVVGDFKNYVDGVYSSDECKNGPMDVNHAVLAVGYGTFRGEDYWIVKNSWGLDFGQDGYFWIARGKNMCGISTCSSYPLNVGRATQRSSVIEEEVQDLA